MLANDYKKASDAAVAGIGISGHDYAPNNTLAELTRILARCST
jgi:hypothetical protein